jgi:uncharacterized protein (TIGR02246 family)
MLKSALLCLGLIVMAPITAMAGSADATVNAAYAGWNAAFNKGDAKAVAATYTADSLFLPGSHEVIEGPAGVEKFFDGLFTAGVKNHQLTLIRASESGDTVIAAAKWSAQGKDGGTLGGVATHIFKKQPDGSLKLLLHTFN